VTQPGVYSFAFEDAESQFERERIKKSSKLSFELVGVNTLLFLGIDSGIPFDE
jgi:hypothetical protein